VGVCVGGISGIKVTPGIGFGRRVKVLVGGGWGVKVAVLKTGNSILNVAETISTNSWPLQLPHTVMVWLPGFFEEGITNVRVNELEVISKVCCVFPSQRTSPVVPVKKPVAWMRTFVPGGPLVGLMLIAAAEFGTTDRKALAPPAVIPEINIATTRDFIRLNLPGTRRYFSRIFASTVY
jgi:hypothetical protein